MAKTTRQATTTGEPDLKPVPKNPDLEGPLRYCWLSVDKTTLTVTIKNEGGDVPDDSRVHVQVDFRNFGLSDKIAVPPLPSNGESKPLPFPVPDGACDPDLDFNILIYMDGELHRTTGGLCAGDIP